MKKLGRALSRMFAWIFPKWARTRLRAKLKEWLTKTECGEVLSDNLMELLLRALDVLFFLDKGFRANIEGFSGRYVFATADEKGGKVDVSAIFKGGDMEVDQKEISDWDVKVTFSNSDALWGFLLSENQDIVDSVLRNNVKIEGNLNYIYKFGFMVKDLVHRVLEAD